VVSDAKGEENEEVEMEMDTMVGNEIEVDEMGGRDDGDCSPLGLPPILSCLALHTLLVVFFMERQLGMATRWQTLVSSFIITFNSILKYCR
jgi:hypothetical protein